MSLKKWVCKTCGHQFTYSNDDYSCPECGRANTIPVDMKKYPTETKTRTFDTRKCTECDGIMYRGNLVNPESPLQLTTMLADMCWAPTGVGLIGKRLSFSAYACAECGKIGLYVIDPEKIEHLVKA